MHLTVLKNQPLSLRRGDYCDNCTGKVMAAAEAVGVTLPSGPLTPLRKDLVEVAIPFAGRVVVCPPCLAELKK